MIDGGTRWADPLYALCPPAPPRVVLDGGWSLFSPERIARLDCIMVTADERRLQLEAAAPFLSDTSLLFAGILFLAGAFLAGYVAWNLRGLF